MFLRWTFFTVLVLEQMVLVTWLGNTIPSGQEFERLIQIAFLCSVFVTSWQLGIVYIPRI